MRLIKVFGLTAMAALLAMAFIGASSASASNSTVVCTENTGDLSCGKAAKDIHGVATDPLLHTSETDVKCASSLFQAKLGNLGNPQTASLSSLTWTNCETHGGTDCTVSTVLKGDFTVLKLNENDAHVQSTGGTAVLVDCGIFIHCTYSGTPTLLALSSTANAKATLHANTTVNEDANHQSSFCPNTSTWLALYESLTDLWIRS